MVKKVGEIREIWRYPVKGMAGESLQTGQLGAHGLQLALQFVRLMSAEGSLALVALK